jgi:2-polyprenyl-6-methoxyphenol hydroxylase-like FAD-dependent oxidoreductase
MSRANPSKENGILIVGAGPTGLSAALFLHDRGLPVRIVDKSAGPSATSRAQVVNPRSLELLEATGVTAAIVAESRPIRSVRWYEHWQPLAEIDFEAIESAFDMRVIPQARTEALLAEALAQRGIKVEREIELKGFVDDGATISAQLIGKGGNGNSFEAALLLAADGARSLVRETLGIDFPGHNFPEAWPLYDIELADPLPLDHAHVSFVENGLIFCLCIRPGLWRVFGNVDNLLEHLPAGSKPGNVGWKSSFHIGDRVASELAIGRVALAGDAAHIHSPVGARGMNLGIEDAYVYAACAEDIIKGCAERIEDYSRLRHPIHKTVVSRMDRLTGLARGRPKWVGLLRHYLIPTMADVGPLTRIMRDFLTGLDHPARLH